MQAVAPADLIALVEDPSLAAPRRDPDRRPKFNGPRMEVLPERMADGGLRVVERVHGPFGIGQLELRFTTRNGRPAVEAHHGEPDASGHIAWPVQCKGTVTVNQPLAVVCAGEEGRGPLVIRYDLTDAFDGALRTLVLDEGSY